MLSEKDRVVPIKASLGLKKALKSTDTLRVVPNATHNDLYKYDVFHAWLREHITNG